jgi:hypothetical protein
LSVKFLIQLYSEGYSSSKTGFNFAENRAGKIRGGKACKVFNQVINRPIKKNISGCFSLKANDNGENDG